MYPFLRFSMFKLCRRQNLLSLSESQTMRNYKKRVSQSLLKDIQILGIVISYNSSYDCQYYLSIITYIISCFQLYNFFGKFPIFCMQTFLLSNSLVLETKINLFCSHNYCPFFSFLGTLEIFVSKVLVDFYRLNEHQIIKIKLVLTIKALNKMLIRFKKE